MTNLAVTIDGILHEVEIRYSLTSPNELIAVVNGEELAVSIPGSADFDQFEWMIVGDRPYELVVDRDLRWMQANDGRHTIEVRDLNATVARPASGDGRVKAPIPGVITRVMVAEGESVESGQPLVVLEAMKMENEIQAPRSGNIQRLAVQSGQTVRLDDLLVEIA
jgi:biotin carboxyl carrier protein